MSVFTIINHKPVYLFIYYSNIYPSNHSFIFSYIKLLQIIYLSICLLKIIIMSVFTTINYKPVYLFIFYPSIYPSIYPFIFSYIKSLQLKVCINISKIIKKSVLMIRNPVYLLILQYFCTIHLSTYLFYIELWISLQNCHYECFKSYNCFISIIHFSLVHYPSFQLSVPIYLYIKLKI